MNSRERSIQIGAISLIWRGQFFTALVFSMLFTLLALLTMVLIVMAVARKERPPPWIFKGR